MALKPDRDPLVWDISRFFVSLSNTNGTVAERGGVVVSTGTVASGAAMDQTIQQVMYGTGGAASRPVGVLMNDVRNLDLTRQTLNPNKSEVQLNDKVTLLRKGWVVTNMIDPPADTIITAEANAYVVSSGNLTPTSTVGAIVGKFMTTVDEDGYAKVYIDL